MKNNIANILRTYRKNREYTPQYVVDKLKSFGMDISVKTLYGYENGVRQPKADMFVYLCKIYDITSIDVFFGEQHSEKHELHGTKYDLLNNAGKKIVADYVDFLTQDAEYLKKENTPVHTPTYKKENSYSIAAWGGEETESSDQPPIDESTT